MSKRLHSINAAMNKQRWIVQPMPSFGRLLYRRRTQETFFFCKASKGWPRETPRLGRFKLLICLFECSGMYYFMYNLRV